MDFIFDNQDTAMVCLVGDQFIGGLELDVVAIAPEPGHQIGAPLDHPGLTGKVIQDLVDDVARDDVKEVLSVNQVA